MATKVVQDFGGKVGWRVVSTPDCYILQKRRGVRKSGKGKGVVDWDNQGYYTTIEHAMNGFVNNYPRIAPGKFATKMNEAVMLAVKAAGELNMAFTLRI